MKTTKRKTWDLLRSLGPGILFASMAVGTSHLVLSTKAGAQFGWWALLPIAAANWLKYPFFEFGIRYTQVTGKSLLQGYLEKGKVYFNAYALVTLVSSITILSTLYTVTAGLMLQVIPSLNIPLPAMVGLLLALVAAVLSYGQYRWLENSLKAVVTLLVAALLITVTMALWEGPVPQDPTWVFPEVSDTAAVLFWISLIGWMPTAVEASSWVSMWRLAKNKNDEQNLTQALKEFKFGYWVTAVLAVLFLMLGLYTFYGTQVTLSNQSVAFADQLIGVFAQRMGAWTYPIVALAAFATMLSSCITAHDALGRISVDTLQKWKVIHGSETQRYLVILVWVLALANAWVVWYTGAQMGWLVATATTVSFVLAPAIGWLNFSLVTSPGFERSQQPNRKLIIQAYAGMIFLSLFAGYYFWLLWA